MNVLVFCTTGTAAVSRLNLHQKLFSHPSFHFQEVNIGHLGDASVVDVDAALIRKSLKMARNLDEDAPVLVISDKIITHASAEKIRTVIDRALNVGDFDLLYLTKFMDRCQLMTKVEKQQETTLMRTLSPEGTDAILYTPEARDIVLGLRKMSNGQRFTIKTNLSHDLQQQIYNGNLKALCTMPNLFTYDVAMNSSTNQDFRKVNECQPVDLLPEYKSSSSGGVSVGSDGYKGTGLPISNLVWFIVITFVILIIGAAAYYIWPRNEKEVSDKPNCPAGMLDSDYGGGNNPMIGNHNGGDHSVYKLT